MRHTPEAGAVCGNSARTDLRGGRGVTSVPTATFRTRPRAVRSAGNHGIWPPSLRDVASSNYTVFKGPATL